MNAIAKAGLIVLAICVGVVVVAPMIVKVLPDLIVIAAVLYLAYLALGGPRYRDR